MLRPPVLASRTLAKEKHAKNECMSKQCTRIYKLLSNITHRANYTYTPCTNIKSTTAIYEMRNITAAREIDFRMF